MKANRKIVENKKGFTFLIPFTMAIVISVALLIVGVYVVGVVSNTLENTYPVNNNNSGVGEWRSERQNQTMNLMGNVTDGFSDVVDIEIVVMIITGLSMAIFAIMAIGTRRAAF